MGVLAKITAKGPITLPNGVRDRYGLKPGDRVKKDGKTWVWPRNVRAVDFMGILGPPPNGVRLKDEELARAIKEAAQEGAAENRKATDRIAGMERLS